MMSLNRQNANFSGVSDNSFSWGDRNKPHLNIIVGYSLITISHSVSLRRLSRCLPLRYSTGHLMMNLCDTELMRRNKFMSSGTCHIIATEGVRLIKFALVSWAFRSGIAAAPFPPLPVPDFFFLWGEGVFVHRLVEIGHLFITFLPIISNTRWKKIRFLRCTFLWFYIPESSVVWNYLRGPSRVF